MKLQKTNHSLLFSHPEELRDATVMMLALQNEQRISEGLPPQRKLTELHLLTQLSGNLSSILASMRKLITQIDSDTTEGAATIDLLRRKCSRSLLMRLVMEDDTSFETDIYEKLDFLNVSFLEKSFRAHNLLHRPRVTAFSKEFTDHGELVAARLVDFLSTNLNHSEQSEFLESMHSSELYLYIVNEAEEYIQNYPSGRYELHQSWKSFWSPPECLTLTHWLHEHHKPIYDDVMTIVLESENAELRALFYENFQYNRIGEAFGDELAGEGARMEIVEMIFDDFLND